MTMRDPTTQPDRLLARGPRCSCRELTRWPDVLKDVLRPSRLTSRSALVQPTVVTALIVSVTSILVAVTSAVLAYRAQHGLHKAKLDQGRRRSMALGESL
jgi:hypothetical protein